MTKQERPIKNKASLSFIRYLGWLLFGLYLLLAGTGRALEYVVGATPWGPPGPPTVDGSLNSVALGIWAFVGALLIYRQPKNPFGWIFSALALFMALDEFVFGYAYYGTNVDPGSLPGAKMIAVWLRWSGRALAAFWVTLLFTLFPTGRPLSPGWGKFLWFNTGVVFVYVIAAAISPLPMVNLPFAQDPLPVGQALQAFIASVVWVAYGLMLFGAIASTGSLVIRFRHSKGIERQQLKWFVFAAAFFVPGIVLVILGEVTTFAWSPFLFITGALLLLVMIVGIPIASAIAILRYNLFDIDIIIRRTLVYSLLTGLLALIYFGMVILLQAAVGAVSGQNESPLITVLSTLIIASLFNPLRRRVQNFIDRRFFRKKYDAQQVLAQFAQTARDETDMADLTGAIAAVLQETLQPERVSLWIRPSEDNQ